MMFFIEISIFFSYILLRLPFLNNVPIWDGWSYSHDLLLAARTASLNLFKYCFQGHSNIFWGWLMGLPDYFVRGNLEAMNLFLAAYDAIGVVFFFRVTAFLKTSISERILLTIVFALHPVVLGSLLNVSPDGGLVTVFLIWLWAWMNEKNGWIIFSGLLMVFTKETAVLVIFSSVIAWYFTRDMSQWKFNAKIAFNRLWPTIFLLFFYFIVKKFSGENALWTQNRNLFDLFDIFLNPFTFNAATVANFQMSLVMNFNWVLSISFLVLLIAWISKRKSVQSVDFLLILSCLSFYLLSRFPTFLNPRYLILIYPLLILVVAILTQALLWKSISRNVFWAGVLLINCIALHSSLDPVSEWMLGTFPFGKNKMYQTCNFDNRRPIHGRDQLVYNLQYLKLNELMNQFYKDVSISSETYLVSAEDLGFRFPNRLYEPAYFVQEGDLVLSEMIKALRQNRAIDQLILGELDFNKEHLAQLDEHQVTKALNLALASKMLYMTALKDIDQKTLSRRMQKFIKRNKKKIFAISNIDRMIFNRALLMTLYPGAIKKGNNFFGFINRSTLKRIVDRENAVFPQYLSINELIFLPQIPKEVYYIRSPVIKDDEEMLAMSQLYKLATTKVYQSDGYQMTVHKFSEPRGIYLYYLKNPQQRQSLFLLNPAM